MAFTDDQIETSKGATGGWSILQSLTTINKNTTINNQEESVYIHPLTQRSNQILSSRSLEMCTENLGSETGSDEFSVSWPESDHSSPAKIPVKIRRSGAGIQLPPPLPSLSGVHVECVREDGRLVMNVVSLNPTHACLEAERENGKLTLRFTELCVLSCNGCYGDADDDYVEEEDMDGIFEEVEGENGNKYPRASTSRCNEEEKKKPMVNLEAILVSG